MIQDFQAKFLAEYQNLNDQQRQAVDNIEGPVMVIAGAGTGKTQTITLRIGKILTTTQVNPNNILCLTFTENAALNMRSRLLSIIGPSAYGVRISTFHGFCNSVIRDNPEKFLFSTKESTAIDDVKQIQIIRQLIDNLPNNSSFKNINSAYFFQKDIIRSIQNLKRENITPDKFQQLVDYAQDFIKVAAPTVDALSAVRASKNAAPQITGIIESLLSQNLNVLYQTRIQYYLNLFNQNQITLSVLKQEIKDFIVKTQNSLEKQKDLLVVYRGYQQELINQNLFDFDDMIYKYYDFILSDYKYYHTTFNLIYGVFFGGSFFFDIYHYSLGLNLYNIFYYLPNNPEFKKTEDYRSYFLPQISFYQRLDIKIFKIINYSIYFIIKTIPEFFYKDKYFYSEPFKYDFVVVEISILGFSINF